tara:strand:+ start:154 stop:426 length:273 start_codon:yes stop_codon:yes gene_type:complete
VGKTPNNTMSSVENTTNSNTNDRNDDDQDRRAEGGLVAVVVLPTPWVVSLDARLLLLLLLLWWRSPVVGLGVVRIGRTNTWPSNSLLWFF